MADRSMDRGYCGDGKRSINNIEVRGRRNCAASTNSFVSKAIAGVIVDDASGLHEGVASRGADEAPDVTVKAVAAKTLK